jgi:hypothetical protein
VFSSIRAASTSASARRRAGLRGVLAGDRVGGAGCGEWVEGCLHDGGAFGVESAADEHGAVEVGGEGQFAAGDGLAFVQFGAVGVEVGADLLCRLAQLHRIQVRCVGDQAFFHLGAHFGRGIRRQVGQGAADHPQVIGRQRTLA